MTRTTVSGFIQVVVGFASLIYFLTGVALLLFPHWFFENIGNFPPFNRHYSGDLGAFLLPLGLGLLFSVRTPYEHRSLIGIVALASLLHALNHAYDALSGQVSLARWFSDTIPLLFSAGLLLLVYRNLSSIRKEERV